MKALADWAGSRVPKNNVPQVKNAKMNERVPPVVKRVSGSLRDLPTRPLHIEAAWATADAASWAVAASAFRQIRIGCV